MRLLVYLSPRYVSPGHVTLIMSRTATRNETLVTNINSADWFGFRFIRDEIIPPINTPTAASKVPIIPVDGRWC